MVQYAVLLCKVGKQAVKTVDRSTLEVTPVFDDELCNTTKQRIGCKRRVW